MRILVVDASVAVRGPIRQELADAGYTVVEAENGEQALDAVPLQSPDLALISVELPDMDGFEACLRLRALELMMDSSGRAGLPVIFLAPEDTPALRARAFEVGTAELIALPAARGIVRETVDAALRPEPRLTGLRALLVEDSPLLRRILCDALAPLGMEVMCAGDGAEALRLLRRKRKRVDFVVTDYVMPRMSGDELCRSIRRDPALAGLPILALSALEQARASDMLIGAGANAFIAKPFSLADFRARVNDCLRPIEVAC